MEQPAATGGSSIGATPPGGGSGGDSEGSIGDLIMPKMTMYKGVRLVESYLPLIKAAHEEFQARPSDIFLASYPKCGTTWLKALAYAIAVRGLHRPLSPEHPLLTNSPHELVPVLEIPMVWKNLNDLESLPSPRLLQTHLPYRLLPESAMAPIGFGGNRVVNLCREPKDAFVSMAQFVKQLTVSPGYIVKMTIDQAFDHFCDGMNYFGTIWDHAREFWEQSNKEPERVLFFKYEDMIQDPSMAVKRLAEFIGFPFSGKEVEEGVVEDIVELCSFEKLSKLDVNKGGCIGDREFIVAEKATFFRNGKIGDWKNHIAQDMANRFDDIVKEKLQGTGLAFVV